MDSSVDSTSSSLNVSSTVNLNNIQCFTTQSAEIMLLLFTIPKAIILLPLTSCVLIVAHRKWRGHCSPTKMNHLDFFTFNLICSEMSGLIGSMVICLSLFIDHQVLIFVGSTLFTTSFPHQLYYHCLACVDRYLAVIYPVTYLKLKGIAGIRIRNVCVFFAWISSLIWWRLIKQSKYEIPFIPFICLLVGALVIVCFCSFAVVFALKQAGVGRDENQAKKRAAYTTGSIMGVLTSWFLGFLACLLRTSLADVPPLNYCLIMSIGFSLSLPSTAVLPLLFLHRERKYGGRYC